MNLLLKASGMIDEHCPLFETKVPAGALVTFDMKDVNSISSFGVKNWIQWTQSFPKGSRLELIHCPFVIINQIITVVGFLPEFGAIRSFFAPFDCENCRYEFNYLFQRGVDFEYSNSATRAAATCTVPNQLPCAKCGEVMIPGFSNEKVFQFLK